MNRVTAIVSGGQTGADRGSLDAAIALDLGYGGWAPKGWRAEDGSIPEIYRARMRESVREDYGLRTRLNVQDSDGTLIISFANKLTGGSEFTAKQARSQKKPCKHLVLTARGETRITEAVRTALLEWVDANRISILNVAGPRESKEPGIQQAVRDALVWVFEDDAASLPAGMTMEAWQPIGSLAEFLRDLECEPRPLTKDGIDRLKDAFYMLEGNGAGGSLHIVLDDNNWERSSVEFCLKYAQDAGDRAGIAFATLLLELTDEQLHEWLGPGYCGRCGADYGDEHVGQTFNNVDGRCPDCGSFPKSEMAEVIERVQIGADGKPDEATRGIEVRDRCDLCNALSSDADPAAAEQARTGFYPPNCPSPCPTCGAPPWFERAENKQPPRDPAPGDVVVSREDFVRKVRFE